MITSGQNDSLSFFMTHAILVEELRRKPEAIGDILTHMTSKTCKIGVNTLLMACHY